MGKIWQNIGNFLEYLGLRSPSYFHTVPEFNYDPNDLLAYYLDMTPRADYPGPFDSNGLPLLFLDGKGVVFPTTTIMYALGHLEKYRHKPSEDHRAIVEQAADWLVANQDDDGNWPVNVPSHSFDLAPPFRSAMVQGLALSLLVRAAVLLKRESYIDTARRGLASFKKTTLDGGVTTIVEGATFYEEYPCQPPCHVLNGFFYAMWGLYDLVRYDQNETARQLWEAGLETVIKWLPQYDLGHWSLYHIPADPAQPVELPNPATVAYHRLHIYQLAVMYAITDRNEFDKYRQRWAGFMKHRINALRTLPAKLRWMRRRNKNREPQNGGETSGVTSS